MKICELINLALSEEQLVRTMVGIVRQFGEEEYSLYERPPCWFLGKGCQARLQINAAGTQARLIDKEGVKEWAVDSITDCARQFLADPNLKGKRVYGQVGFNYAAKVRGLPFQPGEWPLLTLTVPQEELVFEQGKVTVYADSPAECRRLCERVKGEYPHEVTARSEIDTSHRGDDYQQQVKKAVADIQRGEYLKVIVSRAITLPSKVDMAATLLHGRLANTPARTFMFRQEGREALGFSPELIMSVKDNKVVTEQLAGTCDRLGSQQQNRAKGAELLHDSKEVLEHMLSVKEAIAELKAVCQPGSVVVEDLMSIRERGSVQHLGSSISGQIAEDKDAWDAFTELFPSITTSGIPKSAALRAIMRLEQGPRELYSGSILLVEGHSFEAALVLRSVFQDSQRGWLQAGAGIIAQSMPERELKETREKLASIAPYLVMVD